jgi:hypothetical protein
LTLEACILNRLQVTEAQRVPWRHAKAAQVVYLNRLHATFSSRALADHGDTVAHDTVDGAQQVPCRCQGMAAVAASAMTSLCWHIDRWYLQVPTKVPSICWMVMLPLTPSETTKNPL